MPAVRDLRGRIRAIINKIITIETVNSATISGATIQLPTDLQSNYYESVKLIDQTVSGSSSATSSDIQISDYSTKTISGECNFDGTVKIFVSPSGTGNYYSNPLYTETISSGEVFSISFTEGFDYLKVEVDNTSSSDGTAVIWLGMQTR